MLQAIKDKAQGWIAWAIVILISIPFALFGIQEYLGSSADPVIAEVEGVEIKESELERGMRDFRETMRINLGNAYRQELFEGDAFRQQILDRMINEALMRETASDWNMRGSDAQVRGYIQSIPGFQNQGRFDKALYEAAVRNRGMSNAGFEDLVRQELVLRQMQNGVQNSSFVTNQMTATEARLARQKRAIEFARVPMSTFNDPQQVTDADAEAFYEANRVNYRVPERVKLAYVALGNSSLMPLVEVDDDKLQTYFEEHQNEFFAEEERKIRHILIDDTVGDSEAQRAKAEELFVQLQGGADFATLAAEHSSDPGSADNGGDLGWVTRGVMVEAFEESAFSLELNSVSEPVKTDFGYHLIEVTEKRGGSDVTFEQIRADVEAAYRKFHAEELFYDYYERLANAAYENSDSLVPAAETLGLEVRQTDWITRTSPLPSAIDNPKVANAAFSEDVLINRHNSDVIEIEPTEAVVIRVIEHEAETTRPFEEVRDQVVEQAAASLASEKAAKKGEETIETLKAGQSLAGIASANGWSHRDVTISRSQRDVPAEVVDAAFALKPPAQEAKGYTGVVAAEGDFFVVVVNNVEYGEAASDGSASETTQAQRMVVDLARAEFDGVLESLRSRASVEILDNQ